MLAHLYLLEKLKILRVIIPILVISSLIFYIKYYQINNLEFLFKPNNTTVLKPLNVGSIRNDFCFIVSCEDLITYGKKHKFQSGIPKIIHYVYRTNFIPTQYSPHVKQCIELYKDIKFVFWTDFSAYRFMIKHYPTFLAIYSSYFTNSVEFLKISDSIRYFILLKFGGIYMDLDTKCQKSFDSVFSKDSCILSREIEEQSRIIWNYQYLAMNSFMACIPEHNFFQNLVKKLSKSDHSIVVIQTGPILLTNIFEAHNKSLTAVDRLNPKKSVIVADSYIFSPFSEPFLENNCKSNPTEFWRKQGCKDLGEHRRLQKSKINEAIVIHLFLHLGYNFAKSQIKTLDNICLIFQNANVVWS